MTNIFENHDSTVYDNCPIILVDKSGSTKSNYDNMTIFDGLEIITKSHMANKNINSAYTLFWCSKFSIPEIQPVPLENMTDEFANIKKNARRDCTDLSVAIKNIPDEWVQEKSIVDIYIITDGEITDNPTSKIQKFYKKYADKNIRFFIMTLEDNNNDYINENINAGTKIYKIFNENNIMNYIKSFISYNKKYSLPSDNSSLGNYFTSLYKQDLPENYIPFETASFHKNNINEFINYISELTESIQEENKLNKLIHDLTRTIFEFIKVNKYNYDMRLKTIELFSRILSQTDIISFSEIKYKIISEIENHTSNKSTTFQDYRDKRQKLFDNANKQLLENPIESIARDASENNISFPIKCNTGFNIYEYSGTCNETIKLKSTQYKNGGIKITDKNSTFTIPCVPTNISNNEFNNQCLRQWIRAIYSEIYNVTPNDDLLLYLFLTDNFKIQISDLPNNVKETYGKMAMIMLNRRRYNSGGLKEIDYLQEGNPPKPVIDSFDNMPTILNNCMRLANITNLKPYSLWYLIVLSLNNDVLTKNQLKYCKNDLNSDFDMSCNDSLLDLMKNKLGVYNYINVQTNYNYDFSCYLTLDNTSQVGGYMIPPHSVNKKVYCKPRYVITEESYNALLERNNFACPICYKSIELNSFIKVEPEAYYSNLTKQEHNYEISYDLFDIAKYREIDLSDMNDSANYLIELDDANFNNYPYKLINMPYLASSFGGKLLIKSSQEFNNIVDKDYAFLRNIDYDNVCIAGGFCKSLLLGQPVNDIDFFFHGLSQESLKNRLDCLVNNIMASLNEQDPTLEYMLMYKSNTNVFEILVLENKCIDVIPIDDDLDIQKENSIDKIEPEQICEIDDEKPMQTFKTDKTSFLNYDFADDSEQICEEVVEEPEQLCDESDEVKIENYNGNFDLETLDDRYILKHKIQIILKVSRDILDIVSHFDMYSSCIVYDGQQVHMTNKAQIAYQYMINVVNNECYSDIYDERLRKYFMSGFSIGLPCVNKDKLYEKIDNESYVELNKLKCCISRRDQNEIYVEKIDCKYDGPDVKSRSRHDPLYTSMLGSSNNTLKRTVNFIKMSNKDKDEIYYEHIKYDGDVDFVNDREIKFVEDMRVKHVDFNWYGAFA